MGDTRPTIFFASDHGAAANLRRALTRSMVKTRNVVDLGTWRGDERVDYPTYARLLARRVREGPPGTIGVAVCCTGIGMSIAANKVPGIRAALVHDDLTACMARRHNDANVLCLGAKVVDARKALRLIELFLAAPFEGGRHARRNALLESESSR